MITWNRIFFHSPSTYLIEIIIIIHDYIIIFLLFILLTVTFIIIFSFICSKFFYNFYENQELEFLWTILPFIILSFIIFPSLFSLYILDSCLFCGITLKVIGHQWYWRYFYNDLKSLIIDSYIKPLTERKIRLLDTDNHIVIPTHTPLRFLVSSIDVIHSWTIPSFGIKIDAIPGRMNQFCFSTKRVGIFFGQCSEICGTNHRFIPIVLESVPLKNFLIMFNKLLCNL